jgi:DNA polymerase I-like protein with 3'-5' exonuclease and polymerase domains
MYGAMNKKLGSILGGGETQGARVRYEIECRLEGLGDLMGDIDKAMQTRKYLKGLDGRHLYPAKANSALNTLIQGAGAVVCKKGLTLLFERLDALGIKFGLSAWVHDEFQIECHESVAQTIIEVAQQAIVDSGLYFNVKCPLSSGFKIGKNWSETH